jgi:hypothetical protein
MNGPQCNPSKYFHHLQASNWSTVISILLHLKLLVGHNPGRFLASKVQRKHHFISLSLVIIRYITMIFDLHIGVKRAINKLKRGKAPGLNAIPPEALKAMDDTPQQTVHKHVSDFFDGKTDHEGWHKSQCVPVPQKGNLSDPNKWREIMLMDMCSKVFSSIMMEGAFQLLDKHGTRFQFGGTPELGCRDGLFTLKVLLNAR